MIWALLAGLSAAQSPDAAAPFPAADDGGLLTFLHVWSASTLPSGQGAFTLRTQWADAPVRLRDPASGREESLVDNVISGQLVGVLALHSRVSVAVSAPVWLSYKHQAVGAGGPRLGALAVSLPTRLFDLEHSTWSVAPAFSSTLGGLSAQITGALRYRLGALQVAANLGYATGSSPLKLAMGSSQTVLLQRPEQGLLSLGVAYALRPNWGLRAEVYARPSLRRLDQHGVASPAECVGSVRGNNGRSLSWTLGAALPLSSAIGLPKARVFLDVAWRTAIF